MSFRYEIRLSGAGGQGLILIGKILAEAAAIYDEKNATQSQSYGPEARGGASRSVARRSGWSCWRLWYIRSPWSRGSTSPADRR